MTALKALIKWCEDYGIPYNVWNSEYIKGVICFSFEGSEEIIRFNYSGEFETIE
jgi:hypothetical protein